MHPLKAFVLNARMCPETFAVNCTQNITYYIFNAFKNWCILYTSKKYLI